MSSLTKPMKKSNPRFPRYHYWSDKLGGGDAVAGTNWTAEDTVISIPRHLGRHRSIQVVRIAAGGFEGRSSVLRVELPDGLQRIGIDAFRDCVNLQHINLPDSLRSIGEEAFKGCSSLRLTSELPAGLEDIGDGAFEGCPEDVQKKVVKWQIEKIKKKQIAELTDVEYKKLCGAMDIVLQDEAELLPRQRYLELVAGWDDGGDAYNIATKSDAPFFFTHIDDKAPVGVWTVGDCLSRDDDIERFIH